MPIVYDKKTRKYRIGSGKPVFTTKENATKAYQAYLAKKNS